MTSVLGRIPKQAGYGLVTLMLVDMVVAFPAARAEESFELPETVVADETPVSVTALESDGQGYVDPSADQVWRADDLATALPAAGTRTFELQPGGSVSGGGSDSFPVTVAPPAGDHPALGHSVSGAVSVEVHDEQASQAAGVTGLLFEVRTAGAGTAEMVVDYSSFADRYGGSWASRLRLVELPGCARSTPNRAECRQLAEVDHRNDLSAKALSASLPLGSATVADAQGDSRVFALVALASSEGAGDYRATDLSLTGSWAAGGNDGAFTYTYPVRVPPAAGPVPAVTLAYSSASHDGRTSGRNNQASWIGDGWGYEPGFVERTYKPCSLDDSGNNNNPDLTGDLCWDGDGAAVTMSLNGTSTSLVLDDATDVWRAESDANWRIELLGSPATHNSPTTERWRVTTTDGTQYFFAAEAASSSSRWTLPVFGNHPGEPCRQGSFEDSSCRQAYRWMLDKVVDVHGNLSRYFYATTTGHYGAAGDADNRVGYHRSGRLSRIEYGLREGQPGVQPTARVLFDTDHRCLDDCGTLSNPDEENWPDTPWDLHCDEAPCTSQLSPVFFSPHRLTGITTQIRDGSTFRDVDSWNLEHDFKDYGDDQQVVLWLSSIQHTGHVGGTASTPALEFGGEALPNRVDAAPGVPVMWRWRMSSIKTETGSVISIGYRDPQCTPGNLPSNEHNNATRCYPVRWTPEFHTDPIEDWFHKHVVNSVVETDTTGGMPAVETTYEYDTAGGGTSVLWAFDDSEFVEDEHRTYSQWRGYPQVTTLVGDPAQPRTTTRTRFYRGLDGQPLPSGGTRSVNVTDAESNTATDHEALAGRVWETLHYNGSTITQGATYEYWTRKTASRDRDHDGGSIDAWLVGTSVEKTRIRLTSSAWQRAETRTSFDNRGRVVQVNSLGDTSVSGDEYCKRIEYTDNTSAWIQNTARRSETVAVSCGTTPSRPADVVSDSLFFYDGSGTHGAAPTRGLPTRIDVLDDWDSGPVYETTARTVYDDLGRAVASSDALDRTVETEYTPAGPGPLASKTVTNPLGHEETIEFSPAWGEPLSVTDANGRRSEVTMDPLGRTTGVWLPGRSSSATPNIEYEYLLRDDAPSAVITRTMNHQQDYIVDIVLYDSLLRQRQMQVETADHGRLVTETVYDTQGRVEEEFGPNYNDDPPDTTSIVRVREEDSSRRFEYLYDGAGRLVDEIFYNKHVERWRTTTSYGGSSAGFMVRVQPPEGAPATGTLTDARGNVIQKRTYRSNNPSGAHDTLSYAYSPTGRLEAMTDQVGNQWSWQYDLRGRQTTANDPDTGTTVMAYDVAGQLLSTTDARGETIINAYDDLGRQIARRDGDDTLLAEWEYDTAIGGVGLPAKATRWHNGQAYVQQTHTFNAYGLPMHTSVTIPPTEEWEEELAGQYWQMLGYHPNGQLASQSLDSLGDLEDGGLAHYYDHVGNPDTLVFHGFDTNTQTDIVQEATYSPFNELTLRVLGGNSGLRTARHEFVYEDDTRRLERSVFTRTASIPVVADVRYSYDDIGNLLSVADVPDGLAGNHELQCFQYDHNRRLTEAWAQNDTSECAASPTMNVLGGPAPYWHSYDHDVTGNRTSETLREPGTDPITREYSYPQPGQPQPHALQEVTVTDGPGTEMALTYDAAGNTTSRTIDDQTQLLQWDAEGRLATVEDDGDTTQMVYDANGNRLIRDDGDQVTAFLPQGELTWDRTTDTVDAVRYFTHAGQVVAVCTGQDVADWTFLGVDHHGTTTTHAVNGFTAVEQVRRMDPYGNPRGPAPHNWPGQQHFVGGVEDPTGLIHIGARSYDPTTGRFISVDPILALGDDQQINGYAYAHNNPLTYTDPTGQCAWDGHSLCPGIDVKQQPTFHGGCNSYHCGVSGKGKSTAGNSNSPGPQVTSQGVAEHGSTWAVYDDGSATINGWELPGGAGDVAALAIEIDKILYEHDMGFHQTYQAIHWYCESKQRFFQLNCDNDFYGEVAQRNLELLWDEVMEAVEVVGPGFVSVVMMSPVARNKYCRNSFPIGTMVLLADGTEKPIEEVQAGEVVWATDPHTGLTEPRTVTATIIGGEKALVRITVVSHDADGAHRLSRGEGARFGVVEATPNHPFWVDGSTWVDAGDLRFGDNLAVHPALTGASRVITTAQIAGAGDVHNLTVADIHTYYVLAGATPVLVHNCPPGGDGVAPRDVHGLGRAAERGVDVDHVWKNGDMYIQKDGQIVKVLDNGNGTSSVVVRDMSNPSGVPTTTIPNMTPAEISRKIERGIWE